MKNTIKLAAQVAKQTVREYSSKFKTLLGECLKSEGMPSKVPTRKSLKEWYRAHCEEVREWDAVPKVENAPPSPDSTSTHNGISKFSGLG